MDYNEEQIKKTSPSRRANSHKGTYGHVLNIAGSRFYTGAAYFSSISALKTGAGLVTLSSAEIVLQTVSTLSPDIILLPLNKLNKEKLKGFNATSIGCGFSQEKNAVSLFKKMLKLFKGMQTPLVIDADGLNILSKLKNIELPSNTILTPHPKELSRLIGVDAEKILSSPEIAVKECCKKYNCTTVLKLHKTIVADNQDNFYVNSTGNSALSHGGSGDVLCGMITGLLAQGLNCFEASCLAVYLHGLTGELASNDLTEYSVLASDLISYIPKAMKSLV